MGALRFLADENIPSALIRFIQSSGYDIRRVTPSLSDIAVASDAKKEGRVIISLDKDFSNRLLFSPSELTIVWIRIHPPFKDEIIEAFKKLLQSNDPLKGLIILQKSGPIRVVQ